MLWKPFNLINTALSDALDDNERLQARVKELEGQLAALQLTSMKDKAPAAAGGSSSHAEAPCPRCPLLQRHIDSLEHDKAMQNQLLQMAMGGRSSSQATPSAKPAGSKQGSE